MLVSVIEPHGKITLHKSLCEAFEKSWSGCLISCEEGQYHVPNYDEMLELFEKIKTLPQNSHLRIKLEHLLQTKTTNALRYENRRKQCKKN